MGKQGITSHGMKDHRLQNVAPAVHIIPYHNISLLGPKNLAYGHGIKLSPLHEYWLICRTHVLDRSPSHHTSPRQLEVGQRSREIFEERFTLERSMAGMLELYQQVASHQSALTSPESFILRS